MVEIMFDVNSQVPDTRHFYDQNEGFDFCYCSESIFGSLSAAFYRPAHTRGDHSPGQCGKPEKGAEHYELFRWGMSTG